MNLRELVDDLPTQSLDLYVERYEAGTVGVFDDSGVALWQYHSDGHRLAWWAERCCPRGSLGIANAPGAADGCSHPGSRIERMALDGRLDTHALYLECCLALIERDAEVETLPAGYVTTVIGND